MIKAICMSFINRKKNIFVIFVKRLVLLPVYKEVLAWERRRDIDEPARKSKIGRQKLQLKRRGFPLFLVVKTWFDCCESPTKVRSVKAPTLLT